MARRLQPETVLILKNQYAIMSALQSLALTNASYANVVPLLSYQLKETDEAIKHAAIPENEV